MLQLTSTGGDLANRKTRLVAVLMQLWTFIDHFHPDTEHNINWKAALIKAFPKVSVDTSNEEFADVTAAMLAHLNDPATRLWVTGEDAANVDVLSDDPPTAELLASGVWLLKMHSGKAFKGNRDEAVIALDKLADTVANCSKLVIDLRGVEDDADCKLLCEAFEESSLSHALSDKLVIQPRQSVRYYHGLVPTKGTTTGGYTKFRKPTAPESFHPLKKSTSKRVVFLVNQHSHLPIVGMALQFAGSAYIIGDGPVRGYVGNRAETIVIPGLGFVDVRLSEVAGNKASQGGFRVNETVQSVGDSDLALQRAMAAVNDTDKNENPYLKVPIGKFKRSTTRKAFPNELERALAAVRIWFMFSFFFPYMNLMDQDWDQVLLDYLPIFDQCRDALEYVQAVARMTAHVQDSHVWIISDELDRFLRKPVEPFGCRLIEGRAVVTWLGQEAEEGGLKIGDVVERVDGEDVFACMQRFSPFISASTTQHRSLRLLGTIFRGEEGSTISLDVLEGAKQKQIVFCREFGVAVRRAVGVGTGDVVKILDGNIGYVDLTRLEANEVNGMFEKL